MRSEPCSFRPTAIQLDRTTNLFVLLSFTSLGLRASTPKGCTVPSYVLAKLTSVCPCMSPRTVSLTIWMIGTFIYIYFFYLFILYLLMISLSEPPDSVFALPLCSNNCVFCVFVCGCILLPTAGIYGFAVILWLCTVLFRMESMLEGSSIGRFSTTLSGQR